MSELEPTRTYSNHTATDVLRRMLDERGVEYEGETDEDGWAFTRWHGFDDTGWRAASDELCGLLDLRGRYLFTPEQAIAATLGAGTCHIKPWKMERDTGFYDCMECECGYVSDVSDWAKWHFCPMCGRRIEQ